VIPWATLLRHAPTILAAADALVVRSRSAKADAHAAVRDIDGRLASLEQRSSETAQLVQDIAQQVHALTLAQEQTAKRVRAMLIMAVAALIVALAALVIGVT